MFVLVWAFSQVLINCFHEWFPSLSPLFSFSHVTYSIGSLQQAALCVLFVASWQRFWTCTRIWVTALSLMPSMSSSPAGSICTSTLVSEGCLSPRSPEWVGELYIIWFVFVLYIVSVLLLCVLYSWISHFYSCFIDMKGLVKSKGRPS